MKSIKTNFKHINEIDNYINLPTYASSSSSNNIKKTFYQTNTTNFTSAPKSKKNSPNKNSPKKLLDLIQLKKNDNKKISLKKPLISISTPEKEKPIGNYDSNKKEKPRINCLMPTNINMFQHLITGSDFGIFENLNWALGLRNAGRINRRNNELSKKKISVTSTFNEPSFYNEDLEKYKKSKKISYDTKIVKLNPNYDKIKHLLLGKKTGNINYSQFNFSTCLRDYNNIKNKDDKEKDKEIKINSEREKNWKYLPLPKIKCDNYIVKCPCPVTEGGIQNVKKLEKIMPKNYEIKHGEAVVGNDKIKTKILVNNKNYTVCGFGECLGDSKYDNKFGDNNMFANKGILREASNNLSKFELGLRLYGSHKNIKNINQIKLRKKSK